MAQHDYVIANQGFPAFRSDLNDALAAIVSNNSGATEPTTMFAHQLWVDTAANPSVLKIRNADNDAWITVGVLDQTGDTFILRPAAGSATVPAYSTTSDTNTGVYFPGADRVGITTGGTQRVEVDASGNLIAGVAGSGGYQVRWPYTSVNANSRSWAIRNDWSNYGDLAFVQSSTQSGTSFDAKMTLDLSGNLLVGRTSSAHHVIYKAVTTAGSLIFTLASGSPSVGEYHQFYWADSASWNVGNTAYKIGAVSTTSRSINAAGTINASGTDYAEYMTKAGEFDIAKGDICGVNSDGKLTNVFADAVAFVVKSTNPSYVGGDSWGTEDVIGQRPEKPAQRTAEVDKEGNETQAAETDEDFAARLAQYETDLAEFEAKLEVERQKVDRIAFSGQVPVNVTGATAGQYIVPVESNGGITGLAVNEADMTLAQYIKAVGKVIAIEDDGRARIIVKVA